jgi:xylulokinase
VWSAGRSQEYGGAAVPHVREQYAAARELILERAAAG